MNQLVTNNRARWRLFPRLALLLFVAFFLCLSARESLAENKLVFIRDAEIEYYLRELGNPIFRAAGLDSASVNLLLIQNQNVNAFVAGGMNIFFYTGLLEKTETPEELQAVLAHETGHIAGGHLLRGSSAMRNASAQAIIGMLVGLAAGAATGDGRVAVGAIVGAQSMAERQFLRFSRAQESAADAAAMSYLSQTGQSAEGLLSFTKKLEGQDLLPLDRQSEYVRTHPLSQDRVQAIEHHIQTATGPTKSRLGERYEQQHERMKAKLLGYLRPQTALLRYTDKDPRITARYARAIALYRTNKTSAALLLLKALLEDEPDNPFFIELKAQILFESGRGEESLPLYARTVALLPESALLRAAYGHALLERRDPALLDQAIEELIKADQLERRNPLVWRFLAVAWGRKAESNKQPHYQGLATYALAEEAIAMNKDKEARRYAEMASNLLKRGTSYWLRAQDIKLTARDNSKD